MGVYLCNTTVVLQRSLGCNYVVVSGPAARERGLEGLERTEHISPICSILKVDIVGRMSQSTRICT